ncbi:hypothetical protein COO60DRAFT_1540178 [Scenedesmus sp. NREL 46B-D3]|nr:hypothetical protein COO60DRAFT_1540178 [Scenedesmus sp. NREL 46B-D3]
METIGHPESNGKSRLCTTANSSNSTLSGAQPGTIRSMKGPAVAEASGKMPRQPHCSAATYYCNGLAHLLSSTTHAQQQTQLTRLATFAGCDLHSKCVEHAYILIILLDGTDSLYVYCLLATHSICVQGFPCQLALVLLLCPAHLMSAWVLFLLSRHTYILVLLLQLQGTLQLLKAAACAVYQSSHWHYILPTGLFGGCLVVDLAVTA